MAERHSLLAGLHALFHMVVVAAVVVSSLSDGMLAVAASADRTSIPLMIPRQDPNQNYFTFPAGLGPHLDFQDDRTFSQGSQINITWETGLPSTDLILCQPALDGSYGQFRLAANITQRFFVWNVTYSDVTTLAGPVGDVFFFQIRPPSQPNPTYDSHYFNITDPEPDGTTGNTLPNGANTPPQTSSSNSALPKDNSPSSTSSTSTPTEQSDSTSSADPSATSSGLSPGTIGAICGAFVGGFLIAAAFVWWLLVFRRRRRRQRRAKSKVYITGTDSRFSSASVRSNSTPQELIAVSPVQEIGSKPPAHEVETRETPAELPNPPAELP